MSGELENQRNQRKQPISDETLQRSGLTEAQRKVGFTLGQLGDHTLILYYRGDYVATLGTLVTVQEIQEKAARYYNHLPKGEKECQKE